MSRFLLGLEKLMRLREEPEKREIASSFISSPPFPRQAKPSEKVRKRRNRKHICTVAKNREPKYEQSKARSKSENRTEPLDASLLTPSPPIFHLYSSSRAVGKKTVVAIYSSQDL